VPARSPRIPPAASGILAIALALGSAGCASFDAALGQREAVVHFQPQTSNATRLKVRAACSHVPHATPEPVPTGHAAPDLSNDVRYQVTNATDADLAQLQECLQKFPSVAGIDIAGPAGS
jgi:hypothetical protein